MALSLIGDEATVSSIDPPEGSAQASHCRVFYPMARDAMLEGHDWNFATTRAALAPLANTRKDWLYCYAWPARAMRARSVTPPDATYTLDGLLTPVDYAVETLADTGAKVIYTNQVEAQLLYTVQVSDPTRFSPLFVEALGYLLASKLAGPVLKGQAGREAAAAALRMFNDVAWPRAVAADANQRHAPLVHTVGWMAGR